MIEYIWLIAGILGLVSFFLDLKAGENREETLKDLFLGPGFLLWYPEVDQGKIQVRMHPLGQDLGR